MGHTGTGPHGSSNSEHYHPDLGPNLEWKPEIKGYTPETWKVRKDVIYAAIAAIETALGYMPQIKTDVPRWQQTIENDIVQMQCAITELRRLPDDSSR